MAFTTPRTWQPDEDVTPDLMNVHIRDQFRALSGWDTWEPNWYGTGGTPSIGDGTLFGQYRRFGDVCQVRFLLTYGATTTNGGSTAWRWSLPFNMAGPAAPLTAVIVDAGTGVYPGATWQASENTFRVYVSESAPNSIGHAVPFTWAAGDLIAVNGTYRV